MTAEINLSEDASCLKISGIVNVTTVVRLRELGAQLLKSIPEAVVDLQNVTDCDSTALALLTALARDAKKSGKEAQFIHVPSQLMAIAKLSNLNKALSLSS